MGQNESAGIEILKDILREKALEANGKFIAYPLGPQDRNVLADDIFNTAQYFAIVESKWSEDQLSMEGKHKADKVKRLCEGLASNSRMAKLHATCHKISWRDSDTGQSMLQPYRDAVCLKKYPTTCTALTSSLPFDADEFALKFFRNPPGYCIEAQDFVEYVNWLLLTITGKSDKSVIVLAREKNASGKTISKEITLANLAEKLNMSVPIRARAAARVAVTKAKTRFSGPK